MVFLRERIYIFFHSSFFMYSTAFWLDILDLNASISRSRFTNESLRCKRMHVELNPKISEIWSERKSLIPSLCLSKPTKPRDTKKEQQDKVKAVGRYLEERLSQVSLHSLVKVAQRGKRGKNTPASLVSVRLGGTLRYTRRVWEY